MSQKTYDYLLLVIVCILMGLGLVMVYSSSALIAESRYQVPSYYFLKRQAMYVGSGLLILFVAMIFPCWRWRDWCYVILLLSVLLLALVFWPRLGRHVGGAYRWLQLHGFRFQPAEFAKLAMLLYLAHFLTKKARLMDDVKAIFLPLCIILGLSVFLIIRQPDLGTGVLIILLAFSLLFSAGARKRHLFGLAALFSLGLVGLIWWVPYRYQRVLDFVRSWKDTSKAGYQMAQSFYALGAGGWFGRGLGQSIQKRGYLPEAHTDFIFSIIGEELGLAGSLVVLALFAAFIWRGFRIARQAKDPFACYLALGVTCLIGCQALINIGVVVGLLPTKGLPLPFISFGGSSLMVNSLAVGMLLNISQ
ncbi:MAG: putative lipid II flippase FtsW, partial [bacterium]